MNQLKVNITGNIKSISVVKGERVIQNQPIAIVESMKMEIPILSEKDGFIADVLVEVGDFVLYGETIAVIK